tara:strand:- start:1773 stop:2525 length:753 start_codon:yes stop_codon:yes gene_type:complete
MNNEMKGERYWIDKTAEAWSDWIVELNWNYYVTFNFNIWKHKNNQDKQVYENGNFTNKTYRPWDKHFSRSNLILLQSALKTGKIVNNEYWMNDNKKAWTADQKIEHAKAKLRLFNTKLNQAIFGKNFYKKPIGKQEQILFILFPEKISSNLHYHGVAKVFNTNFFQDKEARFMDEAEYIWTSVWNKTIQLDTGERKEVTEAIVPGGQLWIEKLESKDDLRRIADYSTKEMKRYGNEKGVFITNDWTSTTH